MIFKTASARNNIKILEFDFPARKPEPWDIIDFMLPNNDIGFHVSMRHDYCKLVFNSRINDVWMVERSVPCLLDFTDKILIEFNNGIVKIYLDGHHVHSDTFDFEVGDMICQCSLSHREIAPARWGKVAPKPSRRTLKFLGTDFQIPKSYNVTALPENGNYVIRELEDLFMSTAFSSEGMVVDISNSRGLGALFLATMLPQCHIISVLADELELKLAKELLDINKPQNIHLMTSENLNHLLNIEEPDASADTKSTTNMQIMGINLLDRAKNNNIPLSVIGANLFPNEGVEGEQKTYSRLLAAFNVTNILLSEKAIVKPCHLFPHDDCEFDLKVSVRDTPWKFRWQKNMSTPLKPRLDIMVAMYNTPDYVVQCVQSILCEGRDDIRVNIIDDGSTDNSVEIVRQHFGNNSQVKIFSKANGGCASARNYGRLFSDASHIAFIDADDFVDPGYFGKLFDLATYSGMEIVQAGFDFFHQDQEPSNIASYELNEFKDTERISFGSETVIKLKSSWVIVGQPSIWRRVYRRDFLDSKNIYFPEHIRAFDDWIFNTYSLYLARDLLMLDNTNYHYRQHAAQDIKQNDERHFHELEMARMMVRRSIDEGWNNFSEIVPTIINSLNWSLSDLREDLVIPFLKGAARLWLMIEKTYGEASFGSLTTGSIQHDDFSHHYDLEKKSLESHAEGYAWSYLNGANMQPETLKMLQAAKGVDG